MFELKNTENREVIDVEIFDGHLEFEGELVYYLQNGLGEDIVVDSTGENQLGLLGNKSEVEEHFKI